jgi:hypothetical protein
VVEDMRLIMVLKNMNQFLFCHFSPVRP